MNYQAGLESLRRRRRPLILSLCDYSGEWSRPYRETGYDVEQIDIRHGDDVLLYMLPDRQPQGILAAPPCTCFCASGNAWKRSDREMQEALAIVNACLRIIHVSNPAWWALENPVGILGRYLGKPSYYFHPCEFESGEGYTKKTALWGNFTHPVKLRTATERDWINGKKLIHHANPKGENGLPRGLVRAITPAGFAEAFFEANP